MMYGKSALLPRARQIPRKVVRYVKRLAFSLFCYILLHICSKLSTQAAAVTSLMSAAYKFEFQL